MPPLTDFLSFNFCMQEVKHALTMYFLKETRILTEVKEEMQ